MKIKKIFAALLSLAMVLTMLPATAMAADGETTVGSSGVVTNKTATLTDDGTYTINLEAYATGSTTTVTTPVKSGVPLDIILVLDQSGSMSGDLRNLRTAVNSFIGSIEDNAEEYNVDHHIAIVGFAGAEYGYGTSNEYYYANSELFVGSTQYNYMQYGKSSTHNTNGNLASDHYGEAFQSVITEAGRMNLSNSVSALAAKGGTHPEVGFDMVNGIFAANDNTYTDADGEPAERRRIVVMFTDGEPGDNGFDSDIAEETIAEAYTTKNTYDATIYTVGLYNNASQNVTKFMNRVSSNSIRMHRHLMIMGIMNIRLFIMSIQIEAILLHLGIIIRKLDIMILCLLVKGGGRIDMVIIIRLKPAPIAQAHSSMREHG